MKKLTLVAMLVVGAVVLPCRVFGSDCPVDAGYRGDYFYVPYDHRGVTTYLEADDLEKLPPAVRQKLDAYLTRKLGREFAQKLTFDGGQRLDLARLRAELPELYEEKRAMGAYALLFVYSDPTRGLESYYSRVALHEDGTIAKEIDLPDLRTHPERRLVVSCERAIDIARNLSDVRILRRAAPVIWKIWGPEVKAIAGHLFRTIDIDASTGAVLRTYESGFLF